MPSYQIAAGRTIIHGGVPHTEGAPCGFLCAEDVALFLEDGTIVKAPDKPAKMEPLYEHAEAPALKPEPVAA